MRQCMNWRCTQFTKEFSDLSTKRPGRNQINRQDAAIFKLLTFEQNKKPETPGALWIIWHSSGWMRSENVSERVRLAKIIIIIIKTIRRIREKTDNRTMSFIKATKLIRTECGWSIAIGGRKKNRLVPCCICYSWAHLSCALIYL